MIFHGIPLECINQASLHYHVPAVMVISVMQVENGRNGQSVKNKNGTEDLGVMQINTSWLKKLKNYGITKNLLKNNPCLNVEVGTWILAQGIANGRGWNGVGNYNSYTPKYNQAYSQKVKLRYQYAMNILTGDKNS